MKLASSTQMRSLDKTAIEKFGIPSQDLMERAGSEVAQFVRKKFPKKGTIGIVCGRGNNAGDGLVVARHLAGFGYSVIVVLTSPYLDFSPDARANWEKLSGLKNIEAFEVESENDIPKLEKYLKKSVCLIDAIFGTGLSSEVKGRILSVIKCMNSLMKPVVCVDVPSGLNSDTGEVMGAAVFGRATITFGLAKTGLFIGSGPEYAREVTVVDIGFPKELVDSVETGSFLIEPSMFGSAFKPRPRNSHKGDFGHVICIAGSVGKIGAGLLASRAALRSGAGLVTYALPEKAYSKFDVRSPEIMYEPCPDDGSGSFGGRSLAIVAKLLADKKCVAIGPGIGSGPDTQLFVCEVIKKAQVPIVIDADGLNCLVNSLDILRSRKFPTVVTPHPGEMARLIGSSGKEVQSDRLQIAKKFATSNRVWLVLKGSRTIVASPDGEIFINVTGNPGMATAGSGDVLTGVISGFIAQGIPVRDAVCAAVYFHGLAGDMAAKSLGERGLIASDIVNMLPVAMKHSFEVVS